MNTDLRALCAELLQELCCCYKPWELKEGSYSDAMKRANAALAQPEPVTPTDEALANFSSWFCRNYPGPDTIIHKPEWHAPKVFRAAADAITRYARPAIQPEPVRLAWSEVREPCEECRYNHCIAETPFGRILISWKGWKDCPAITPDEVPWGDSWFPVWSELEKAKAECEAEYSRRIALSFEAPLTP